MARAEARMAGRGSTGNVIAALASFFIPGLGQLLQGRLMAALLFFVLSGVIWLVTLGLLGVLGHIIACVEAAVWKGR
jgi:TM2 domain-containing membrane protein YozV